MPILLGAPRRLGPDTVQTLERAAIERLADADALRSAGRNLAAIDFYGYATEMRIKSAYFRALFGATGRDPRTPIDDEARKGAVGEYARLALKKKPGSHDISGWARLLVAKRADLAMTYPSPFRQEVVFQADILYHRWREFLRYRANKPYGHELRAVQGIAAWFAIKAPDL